MIVRSTRFRRTFAAVTTVALTLAGLAAVPTPASASGVITPSATSVAVGGSISVVGTGCDEQSESDTGFVWQYPRILFVTGVGATERAIQVEGGDEVPTLTVPGWVDPDEAAVLRGACFEIRYDGGPMEEVELFTYPEVPIDVVAAEGDVRTVEMAMDRDTAAGGQVVLATVTGCRSGDYVSVSLLADTDLAMGGTPRRVAGAGTEVHVAGEGPVTVELELISDYDFPPTVLPEGDYVAIAACYAVDEGYATWPAEPAWLYVRGAAGTGSITVERGSADGTVAITGDGCIGRQVTVRIRGEVYGDRDDQIDEAFVVEPSAEGSWSTEWTTDAFGFYVSISADCGDPMVDGFRYLRQSWYENGYSDQWIARVSPTSSPAGGQVRVHVTGRCDGGANVVRVLGEDGSVLSEGAVVPGRSTWTGSATVTAPSAPGTYRLMAVCGGRPSYPEALDVFTPGMISATAPLPPAPTTGWPDSGEREEFHGRIGPIKLPKPYEAEAHGGAGAAPSADDLGPSGLGVAVPRPSGDFAITKLSFDLVDEHGNPVGHSKAHLHHMVIAKMSSSNPACPGGTFGLPGEIIAAAGAERTALDFGGPYGLVVEAEDPWLGVYEVMNMLDEEQTVYLSYEMEIRRDVENVRPVRTYFGSASGCGSFTWTIDGSGLVDRQAHYISVASDAVLVGAGGHIHNGGVHTELYNDRGRLLCRNELITGGHHHLDPGPGSTTTTTSHHHAVARSAAPGVASAAAPATFDNRTSASRDESTTTSVLVDDWPDDDYEHPPEMYPDDPPIDAITGCRPYERISAGERLYFEATYSNDRPRSGVMGIFMLYVWEGGGPATPNAPPGTTTTIHDHGPSTTVHDHGSPTTVHDHSTPTTGHDHGTPTSGHDHSAGHDHSTPTTGHGHGATPGSDPEHGHHDLDDHVAGEHGGHVAGEHGGHVGAARPAVAHRGHAHYAG